MSNETQDRPGLPRLMIAATLFFVVGMGLIVAGLLGAVPVAFQQLGSLLALVAVILRVVSRARVPRRKPEDAADAARQPPRSGGRE